MEYLERQRNRDMLARINEAYADDPNDEELAFLEFVRRQQRRIAEAES
ncbi:MAG: hypothetical protein ACYC6A_18250 [Armatimonadota bacterium]